MCKLVCSPGCSTLGWDSPSLPCKDLEGEQSQNARFFIPRTHLSPALLTHGWGWEAPTTGSGLEGWGHPGAPSSSFSTTGILAQVCLAAELGVEPRETCSCHHWALSCAWAAAGGWCLSHCSAWSLPSSGKSIAAIGAGRWKGVSSTGQPVG